ncbi:MAG: hypothetical protein JWP10_1720, partial [Nocardioidaceae bacterium]|nr:hypothetical protein [Nocardioidaceae bacterium]
AKPRNVRWERAKTFFFGEKTGAAFENSKANARLRQTSLDFLDSAISDPELRKALTPDYAFKCKRVVRSSDFYAALDSERAELVPRAVTHVTANGVVDAGGVEHAVDVIVMATGFEAAKYLQTINVIGRNGVRLHDAWGDEPEAFLGISYPDFPNFFMLYGPNSNSPTASIIFILETQADFVIRQARRLKRKSGGSLEVRRGLHSRYNRWLQKRMTSTVWMTGCTNYQRGPTGRVVTNWPHHALLFWALTKMPTWMSSTTSPTPRTRTKELITEGK